MTKDEALKLALEALENQIVWFSRDTMIGKSMREKIQVAITAIKEALAQPAQETVVNEKGTGQIATTPPQSAQEPVGKWTGKEIEWSDNPYKFKQGQFIYTTPPQRPWVGLTDDEIKTTLSQLYCDINQMKLAPDDRPQKETVGFLFARAIEQALKEKNT
jgi:hypothetical protein